VSFQFLEGFTYLDQTILTETGGKFDGWLSDTETDIDVSASYGRSGTGGLRLTTGSITTGERATLTKYLSSDLETVIVGCAVRVESAAAGLTTAEGQGLTKPVVNFLDGNEYQCALAISPSMRLVAKNGAANSTNIIGRSDFYLHENVYYYIEVLATISNVGGVFKVWVDGVLRLNLTDVTTQTTTNSYTNGVRFGLSTLNNGQGRRIRYDDIYILDPTSGLDHTLGDVIVDELLPNAEFSVQWTPSGAGTLRYDMVNDTVPDGASTYNSSSTTGAVDLFSVENYHLATSGSIWGVGVNLYARKPDAGIVTVSPAYRTGSTTTKGAPLYLNMTYNYHSEYTEENPVTSSQWANVPSSQFGYRKE